MQMPLLTSLLSYHLLDFGDPAGIRFYVFVDEYIRIPVGNQYIIIEKNILILTFGS